jgi:Rab3 GTPase-activating protein catalytic subunit
MEDPRSVEMNHDYQQEGGQDMAIRGYLSVRMQCEGNLWQELWASAKPVPAIKQAPLFDEELAGESTLDALENLAPSDLFEQLFTAALSAGFAIAEASPAAKRDHVATCLKECTDYIVTTCTRGMSTSKLEHLCEVCKLFQVLMQGHGYL